jgi:O-antigen ligase
MYRRDYTLLALRFALISLAFLIPFGARVQILITIASVVATISWLLSGPVFRSTNPLFYVPAFLFIYSLFSILWSDNKDIAMNQSMVKLSFLMVPIILGSSNLPGLFRQLMQGLTAGCLSSMFICTGIALHNFYQTGYTYYLWYSEFSIFQHVGYVSIYLGFIVLWETYQLPYNSGNRILSVCIIILSSIYTLVLAYKTGIAATFLAVWILIAFRLLKRKKITHLIVITLMILSIFPASWYIFPGIRTRTDEFLVDVKGESERPYDQKSVTVRKDIWNCALHLYSDMPVRGYGAGDTDSLLLDCYKENKVAVALKEKLNAHNQFIQTLLSLGWPGLCILCLTILLFLYPLHLFRFCLMCIPIVHMMTETILERQAGVIVLCLLFFSLSSDPLSPSPWPASRQVS